MTYNRDAKAYVMSLGFRLRSNRQQTYCSFKRDNLIHRNEQF